MNMFKNRSEAGKKLAAGLLSLKTKNSVVLAIPRGGVPVGYEVAKILNIPLTVIIARKIGDPQNRELGIGAISEKEVVVLDEKPIRQLDINKEEVDKVIDEEKKELKRRVKVYRKGQPLSFLKGKTVFLTDDGVARGVTALAAVKAVKKLNPKKIIFATPVCSSQALGEIKPEVGKLVCLVAPSNLTSIGEFYENFSAVTDDEVINLLKLKITPSSMV